MNFDLFNAVLVPAAWLSLAFGLVLAVWIWRTRPSRMVPAYRRTGPDAFGRYSTPVPIHRPVPPIPPRVSVDGRRRDMRAM